MVGKRYFIFFLIILFYNIVRLGSIMNFEHNWLFLNKTLIKKIQNNRKCETHEWWLYASLHFHALFFYFCARTSFPSERADSGSHIRPFCNEYRPSMLSIYNIVQVVEELLSLTNCHHWVDHHHQVDHRNLVNQTRRHMVCSDACMIWAFMISNFLHQETITFLNTLS